MTTPGNYPGTAQHQALLAAVTAYYSGDARVLALSLFGSLARGNWDVYSDLDLDVVMADGVQLDVLEELERLCTALAANGQTDAIIVLDKGDAADVVFSSSLQFSIRYHPLATTSPNIVDSLRLLAGRLDRATIAAAGLANRRPARPPLGAVLNKAVRDCAVADVAVRRGQLWLAVEMLHRVRGSIMQLYALAHQGERVLPSLEANALLAVQLGGALPQYTQASMRQALIRCLDMLEHDLGALTDGQAQLSAAQQRVLDAVRARQN
jgi:predicted nucleotidyltransferase